MNGRGLVGKEGPDNWFGFQLHFETVFCFVWGEGSGAGESAPNSFPDNLGSFPDSSVGKESACSAGNLSLIRFLVGKICWRRDRLPTPAFLGFPCGSAGKESTCNVGDLGWIPGLGRSPG